MTKKLMFQILKYSTTGLLALGINLIFLFILTEIFKIFYLISAVLAFLISMSFSFICHGKWTFPDFEPRKRKYMKFLFINILILLWDTFFLFILVEFINIEYLISQTIAFSFSGIANFFIQKKLVFKN